MVDDVTAAMSRYYARCADTALPDPVVDKTLHHVIDTLAAAISGAQLPPGRLGRAFAERQGGHGRATIVGGGATSEVMAAFANGMAAHADESDDSHAPALLHPGCSIVPSALAVCEGAGRSGAVLLRAVAAGYDAAVRLNVALGLHTLSRGESNPASHLYGPKFGSAVAAGVAAGLDEERFRHLFVYTAQQLSGTTMWLRDTEHVQKAFDFGGMPARDGVWAALAVDLGFTGVTDALDGPHQNLPDAVAQPGRWPGDYPRRERFVEGLGERFEIVHANIKRYCVGSPIQAAVDGLGRLQAERPLTADEVRSIEVALPDDNYYVVDDRAMPNINLQHLLALQVVDGDLGFVNVHDETRVGDPRVLAVKARVALRPERAYRGTRQAEVTVEDERGERRTVHVEHVRGTADDPMDDGEIETKARDLMAQTRSATDVDHLIDALWALPSTDDVRSLAPLLAG